jgi:hypothetical protein
MSLYKPASNNSKPVELKPRAFPRMKIHRFVLLAILLTGPAFTQAPAHLSYYSPSNEAIIGNNSADWSSSIRIGNDAHSFWIGGTHHMWIRSSGNVGIGTSSPAAKLDVAGSVRLAGGAYLPDQANSGAYVDAGNTGFRGTHTLYTTPWGPGQVGASYGVTWDGMQGRWEYAIGSGSTYGGALLFSQTTGSLLFYSTGTNSGTNGDDAQSHMNVKLLVDKGGNVGIGTSAPLAKLNIEGWADHTNGNLLISGNEAPTLFLRNTNGGLVTQIMSWDGAGNDALAGARIGTRSHASKAANIHFTTDDAIRVTIKDDGNVGIGTTNPTHKLAVNGTIKAKEVIVETTGWSDYVFADGYALAPLAEVEAHIKEHKHLPGIPSAAHVADHGVSVGEMQAKLLAKIEELTLHQIAQEKELAALRTKVARLEGVAP